MQHDTWDPETLRTVRFALLLVGLLGLAACFAGCEGVRVGGSYCHGDDCVSVWTDRPAEGPATVRQIDPVEGPNFGPASRNER